jgi:UDP-4-amino-4,6-dideoxy-N-acetyl-beta-L-altrosamine transaminase
MIPYGRQDISEQDVKAVTEVLLSDFLTQGPKITEFETTLTSHTGAKFAVAVNSATSALHIACLALGVGPGDIVWTSPVTFVASANCALYCGAEVDFVDIDKQTYNMCPDKLEEKLEEARISGRLPKVIIPVHLAGQSCEMDKISKLSQKYGFKIIEDASHAIGGKYKGQPIGDCRYSDITVFSFHPVKIVTTAEGGAALCNDEKIKDKLHLLRSHGITRDEKQMVNASHGPWYYEQIDLGFNYRMTDVHAALGISQMGRVDDFIQKRHVVANRYFHELADLPIQLPYQHPETFSAFHLFIIKLKQPFNKTHKEVFIELREKGIGVNLHYIPVYHHPYYVKLGFKVGACPIAEDYYSGAISIPMYSSLTVDDQMKTCQILKDVLNGH